MFGSRPASVVAGEQRRAARAQVMTLTGVEHRPAARNRTFQVGKKRHT
jgi:hypothetical protein